MSVGIPDVARVHGRDGKTYPRRARQEKYDALSWAHHLAHDGALSVRQTVAALAAHGFPRSVGTVHHYLTAYLCEQCPRVQVNQSTHLNTTEAGGRDV